jgi:hypothetical protein
MHLLDVDKTVYTEHDCSICGDEKTKRWTGDGMPLHASSLSVKKEIPNISRTRTRTPENEGRVQSNELTSYRKHENNYEKLWLESNNLHVFECSTANISLHILGLLLPTWLNK